MRGERARRLLAAALRALAERLEGPQASPKASENPSSAPEPVATVPEPGLAPAPMPPAVSVPQDSIAETCRRVGLPEPGEHMRAAERLIAEIEAARAARRQALRQADDDVLGAHVADLVRAHRALRRALGQQHVILTITPTTPPHFGGWS